LGQHSTLSWPIHFIPHNPARALPFSLTCGAVEVSPTTTCPSVHTVTSGWSPLVGAILFLSLSLLGVQKLNPAFVAWELARSVRWLRSPKVLGRQLTPPVYKSLAPSSSRPRVGRHRWRSTLPRRRIRIHGLLCVRADTGPPAAPVLYTGVRCGRHTLWGAVRRRWLRPLVPFLRQGCRSLHSECQAESRRQSCTPPRDVDARLRGARWEGRCGRRTTKRRWR
jgi:hypothetical protein